jgi:hypothetical protein
MPDGTAGLCARCAHARRVVNDRGSVFVRCAYAAIDSTFAKYPPLPVRACTAYAPVTTDGGDGAAPAASSSRKGQPLRD